ncbi:MAG: Rieske (2Fe-2S) protein [Candidatus Sumerlaeaceae bacterium]|nr:Rieske (2Fe-2S) protein [Candidatus Sumerlaeaceae bacterium]
MGFISRREFVEMTLAACACAVCPAMSHGETTGTVSAAAAPAGGTDVGDAKSFTKDGVWDTWASAGFFLVREKGYLFAVSNVCTHKGGKLVLNPAVPGQIKCTKHEGFFDNLGNNVSGPPKQKLPRLAIGRNAQGHIIVDASQKIQFADWGKAGAYVKL